MFSLTALLAGVTAAAVDVRVNGAMYPGLTLGPQQLSFYLMAAEADVTARLTNRTRDLATVAIQLWAGASMPDWKMGFHLGQAYVLVPLGLNRPVIRVGQAVIPFGLLRDYDTHGQIVQTPYERTLGQRLDLGAGLLGTFRHTDYALWISNGTGPYRLDADWNKVITARVAPKFMLGDAELTTGLSLLAGALPCWTVMDTMGSMVGEPPAPVMKYRAALDNTTDWGPLTLRLEGVLGKDSLLSRPFVFGYYAEARYALVSWLEVLAKYDGFHAGEDLARNLSAGFTFYPPKLSAMNLQLMFEQNERQMHEESGMMNDRSWDVNAMLAVRF
jgi:hypothetical protein